MSTDEEVIICRVMKRHRVHVNDALLQNETMRQNNGNPFSRVVESMTNVYFWGRNSY